MLNHLLNKKWLLAAIALLIVGGGALFLWRYPGSEVGTALIMQAWQAAFQGSRGSEVVVGLPLASSSELSGGFGQANGVDAGSSAGSGIGTGAKKPISWPTSITPVVITGKTGISPAAGEDPLNDASDTSAAVPTNEDVLPSALPAVSVTGSLALAQPCGFSGITRVDATIVLNEVAWMGSLQSPNDEWLELRNIAGRKMDIGNWQIQNQGGSIKIYFSGTSTIAQDGFFLAVRNGATIPGVQADLNYSGALSNAGDKLRLFDAGCRIVDELNAASGWSAGNNTTKQTFERDVTGTGWHTSVAVGGSPRTQNSVISSAPSTTNTSSQGGIQTGTSSTTSTSSSSSSASTTVSTSNTNTTATTTATTTASGNSATSSVICDTADHLLIAAIQITGGAGATAEDYIKIYNPTAARIDLSGWKLRKRTKTGTESSIKVFANGSGVAASGYFVWANSANGFSAGINADASSTQTVSDDNSIALLDASDTIVDALAWGSGQINPFVEGHAYPTNPAGDQALKRKLVGGVMQDSDNNALDFGL